ncbi:response regulator transcription factor [Nitrospiraceae bacterium AH_259_D15_M11_P09]|nr:response regulator transcription factor [Nitrospiraceae bacterium AH_259_D15_M11_P09]
MDDHEVVRLGLRTVLGRDPSIQVVGEAGTMAAAVEVCLRLMPDLVLMDVRLPDGSGVEACREIRSARPQTRVIFLTSYADEDAVLATIAAGADGYLLKEIDGEGLLRAIKTVVGGQSILDPAITQRVLRQMHSLSRVADDESPELSAQEQRVVALVAEGKTNKEIAAALGLSDKTVKNYLANVFQKLHVTRRSQAAAYFVRRTAS